MPTKITNLTGQAEQHIQYLPFGELFVSQRNTSFDSRYKFTAKELDNETNYTYTSTGSVRRFGARYYDSDLSIWLSVDPLSDKYPSLSPYAYCANNPVILVDPDGMEIETTEEGLNVIKNTVSKRDAKYIKLNDQGFIDKELLNKSRNNSGNMKKLKTLVNAEDIIQFKIDDNFDYADSEGNIKNEKMPQTYVDCNEEGGIYSSSTKEFGFYGVAQYPGNEKNTYNSPNDKFNVTINKSLSEQGRAEITAHELYGHTYLKIIGKYSSHIFKSLPNGGQTEGNELLMRNILKSQREVQIHFRNRNK